MTLCQATPTPLKFSTICSKLTMNVMISAQPEMLIHSSASKFNPLLNLSTNLGQLSLLDPHGQSYETALQ